MTPPHPRPGEAEMIDRVAAEMRRQCGKVTDDPWETLSPIAKKMWRKRAFAVIEVLDPDKPADGGRLL